MSRDGRRERSAGASDFMMPAPVNTRSVRRNLGGENRRESAGGWHKKRVPGRTREGSAKRGGAESLFLRGQLSLQHDAEHLQREPEDTRHAARGQTAPEQNHLWIGRRHVRLNDVEEDREKRHMKNHFLELFV